MKKLFLLMLGCAAATFGGAQVIPPVTEQQLEDLTESIEAPIQDDQYLTNLQ